MSLSLFSSSPPLRLRVSFLSTTIVFSSRSQEEQSVNRPVCRAEPPDQTFPSHIHKFLPENTEKKLDNNGLMGVEKCAGPNLVLNRK